MKKNPINKAVSLNFIDDRLMKKLNRKYRKKNKTTDVLSFNLNEEGMLGEVYISIPQAKRQAKEYNCSLDRELVRLTEHGILHLLGYTHKEMEKLCG
jgi:probable rRNA maturation factor